MHHAWLLVGKHGLGKGQFAHVAARSYVGTASTAAHPDILTLTHLPKDAKEEKKRDEGKPFEVKRNISVDQIRAMQSRLTTRPTLGDRRAIIIEPADDMEKSASNALLKSLEEPPQGTLFLLVTHRPGRLLPTIRSRCRVLRFAAMNDAEIAAALRDEFADAGEGELADAVAFSGGSLGVARQFLEMKLQPVGNAMAELALHGDRGMDLRGRLVTALGPRPARERQAAAIDLARTVLANRMGEAAPRDIPALTNAHAELSRLSGQVATYNFDPGLLALQIGTLLAAAAPASERSRV